MTELTPCGVFCDGQHSETEEHNSNRSLESAARVRHPSVATIVRWFDYEHLSGQPRNVAMRFQGLAEQLLMMLYDGPELTAALRKLLEAKDCAVRQAVADQGGRT